jgi:hypothetical protein
VQEKKKYHLLLVLAHTSFFRRHRAFGVGHTLTVEVLYLLSLISYPLPRNPAPSSAAKALSHLLCDCIRQNSAGAET